MFGFGKRQSSAEPPAVGLFGKAPVAGDFLFSATETPVDSPLKDWIEQGVNHVATRRVDDWRSLDTQPAQLRAFVYRGESGKARDWIAVGLIRPSGDAVGRRFPLAVYSALHQDIWAGSAHLLPLSMSMFLQDALRVFDLADRSQDPRTILSGLRLPSTDSFALSRTEYANWLLQTPNSTLWQAVFGNPDWRDLPSNVLSSVREALAPWRGKEFPQTPLMLRVPLGSGGSMTTAFWFDLIRRLAAWKKTSPCAFWNIHDGGSLTVSVGGPHARSLGEMWLSDESNDYLCDFGGRLLGAGELPKATVRTLEADSSAQEVLESFSD